MTLSYCRTVLSPALGDTVVDGVTYWKRMTYRTKIKLGLHYDAPQAVNVCVMRKVGKGLQ